MNAMKPAAENIRSFSEERFKALIYIEGMGLTMCRRYEIAWSYTRECYDVERFAG